MFSQIRPPQKAAATKSSCSHKRAASESGPYILPSRTGHILRTGQNPRPVRGDGDGVLEVSGRTAIRRFRRPLIAHADFRTARIHHRLDRDYHSFLQSRAAPRFAVIRQVRLIVHSRTDAVPDKFANHRKTVLFDQALHRVTNIAEPVSRAHLVNRTVERFLGHVQELLHFRLDLADRNRDRRIRVVPIDFHSEIDRYDVAFLQLPLRRRNPVNDFAVHRRAKNAGITPISLERRLAGLSRDEPLGFFLEVHRGHSRLYKLPQSLQHLVDGESRAMHFFELFGAAQMNRHISSAPASRSTRSAKPVASLLPRSSPRRSDTASQAFGNRRRAAKSASRTPPIAARSLPRCRRAAASIRRRRRRTSRQLLADYRKYCKSLRQLYRAFAR